MAAARDPGGAPDDQSPKASSLAVEVARGATGLLIVDMISAWDFPDADKLLPAALTIAPRIAALRRRCKARGVPVIYANDNRGRWRSDFAAQVELSMGSGAAGARITAQLLPETDDYFVLKPQQSAFVATPLAQLLGVLGIRRLIVAGVASDQCVLSTATDARMHQLEVLLPRDCIGTQTARRQSIFLAQCALAFGIATTPGARIRLPAAATARGRP
ncbi:nicotinamidase-related amidase [Variovorax boronicumulans]|uniref:cysteine hydrolase family protein n=1 Tax=Variovorax boronicumulans TaxID=436515 RepID=UPI002784C8BD|nr:isochorismatase family cysteine hydrolase [Variovorax boronicumulans]MDP9917287.1 nicotinamidase-related amidase [Variovorax boronicumulans]